MPEADVSATLPPLREVIARHGLSARRALGQNFLLDLNLTRRIARAADALADSTVIEIGPGPGGLTRALLSEGARQVIALERDPRCAAALAELRDACPGRLTVIEGDALETDLAGIAAAADGPVRIVANLPFNIATRLLLGWLEHAELFDELILMFQKEVADRITAAPGTAAYGRLSVIAQWTCRAERLFDVPPRAFVPQPKVAATVVRLVPRPAPLAPAGRGELERVTRAAFGQRRKMLRSSLKALGADPMHLLERAGIAPTARAETLSIEQFCALARLLAEDEAKDGARDRSATGRPADA